MCQSPPRRRAPCPPPPPRLSSPVRALFVSQLSLLTTLREVGWSTPRGGPVRGLGILRLGTWPRAFPGCGLPRSGSILCGRTPCRARQRARTRACTSTLSRLKASFAAESHPPRAEAARLESPRVTRTHLRTTARRGDGLPGRMRRRGGGSATTKKRFGGPRVPRCPRCASTRTKKALASPTRCRRSRTHTRSQAGCRTVCFWDGAIDALSKTTRHKKKRRFNQRLNFDLFFSFFARSRGQKRVRPCGVQT